MQDFSKRHLKNRLLFRFFLQLGGVVLLGFIAFLSVRGAYSMYEKFSTAAAGQAGAQEKLSSLREQKDELGAAVAEAETHRGVEAQVRERYGVAKVGEGRIEIVRENATSTVQSSSSNNIFVKIFEALWPF